MTGMSLFFFLGMISHENSQQQLAKLLTNFCCMSFHKSWRLEKSARHFCDNLNVEISLTLKRLEVGQFDALPLVAFPKMYLLERR